MFEKERLHPAAIIQNIIKALKDSLFLFILAFVTFETNMFLIIISIYISFICLRAILSWFRYSYWVDEDEIHMEYGIIKRTKRTISKNRIQSIDLTENIIHRLFKLVRVQIETASTGTQAEASLAAVTLEKGKKLRQELKYTKTAGEFADVDSAEEESEEAEIKSITFKQLLFAGITSGGVGIILGFVVVGLSEMEELIPETVYDITFEWFVSTSIFTIILFILLVLIVVWLLSVGWTLIRYGNFTIKRTDDELLITRGLLEKKQVTIPLHRIQAVGIEENMLRQPFGYGSLVAEVAGGSSDKQTDASVILFPVLAKKAIPVFLKTFVPGFDWDPAEIEWTKPPTQAAKFYLLRSGLLFFLLSLVLIYFLPAYTWAALLIVGLVVYRGWLGYKDAGFYTEKDRLLLRYRVMKRVTVLLYPKRIQAFKQSQHPLQKRDKLTTLHISIISSSVGGKHYSIKDLREEDVSQLENFYFSKRSTSQKALHTEEKWNTS